MLRLLALGLSTTAHALAVGAVGAIPLLRCTAPALHLSMSSDEALWASLKARIAVTEESAGAPPPLGIEDIGADCMGPADVVEYVMRSMKADADAGAASLLSFAVKYDGDKTEDHLGQLQPGCFGTPAALLSSLLGSNSIPLEHQRVIIDSVEPASLTAATMRSLWGRTAILTERVDDGIEVLTRLIQERRHFPIDRFVLASALHKRDDHQGALRVLGQLGSKPRADLEMRLLRASILYSLDQHDACRELTEATLAHYPHEKRAMALIRKLDQTT